MTDYVSITSIKTACCLFGILRVSCLFCPDLCIESQIILLHWLIHVELRSCPFDNWDVKSVVQVSWCLFLFINSKTCLSAYWKTVYFACASSVQSIWPNALTSKNCYMLQSQRGPLPCLLIQWVTYYCTVLQWATILLRLNPFIKWQWIFNEYLRWHIPTSRLNTYIAVP